MEDEEARHPRQGLVEKVVSGAVAHLVEGQVEGLLAMALEEAARMVHAHARGQRQGVHRSLGMEDVDLVGRCQEGQHLGRVVGDARGRGGDGRQDGEAHQRRARRAYSRGP